MPRKKLDLNLILIFLAVYRTRSTTLAGLELQLTQSAVSNGLRRLRSQVDDPLFVRTARGMTPTPLGTRMYGPLSDAVKQIDGVVFAVDSFDPRSSSREFRVHMGDMGQLVLMPRLLQMIERRAPGLSISVVDASPREAYALMAEGELDLAIGSTAPTEGNFHSQRLFPKTYVVMGRRGHPALRDGLTAAKFLRARFAAFRPPGGGQDAFEEWLDILFKAHDIERRPVVKFAHGLGIIETIVDNDLLVCVPQRMALLSAGSAGIEFAPLPFDYPTVYISQFWHHKVHSDSGHKWLRSAVFRNYSRLPTRTVA